MYGESDELGFSVAESKVSVHDLQATLLHQLGFNHERLTYRFQGRDYRLTDVEGEWPRPGLRADGLPGTFYFCPFIQCGSIGG